MEEKYYTPEISEFHVGFEYEFRQEDKEWQDNEDNEVCCDLEVDPINLIKSDIKNGLIRVKYLDASDIESFGFKNCGKHYSLPYNDPRKHDDITHLIYQPITEWLLVCQGGDGDTFADFKTRFSGYIKNKSELSKLLKQLAII